MPGKISNGTRSPSRVRFIPVCISELSLNCQWLSRWAYPVSWKPSKPQKPRKVACGRTSWSLMKSFGRKRVITRTSGLR